MKYTILIYNTFDKATDYIRDYIIKNRKHNISFEYTNVRKGLDEDNLNELFLNSILDKVERKLKENKFRAKEGIYFEGSGSIKRYKDGDDTEYDSIIIINSIDEEKFKEIKRRSKGEIIIAIDNAVVEGLSANISRMSKDFLYNKYISPERIDVEKIYV